MRSPRIAIAVLSLGLVLAACGDDDRVEAGGSGGATTTIAPSPGTVPATAPDLTGEVTSVTRFVPVTEDCTPPEDLDPDGSVSSDDPPVCTPEDNDVLGSVLVEEQPGIQTGDKVVFTVTTSTVLLGADGVPLDGFDDLAEGQQLEAWSTGMCAESYPAQCTAVALRLA